MTTLFLLNKYRKNRLYKLYTDVLVIQFTWISLSSLFQQQINTLNAGRLQEGSLTVPELSSMENLETDPRLKPIADHQIYISYDFYPMDNPRYHKPKLYGFWEGKQYVTYDILYLHRVLNIYLRSRCYRIIKMFIEYWSKLINYNYINLKTNIF